MADLAGLTRAEEAAREIDLDALEKLGRAVPVHGKWYTANELLKHRAMQEADGEFIAAFDPPTALALISEIRTLRAAIAKAVAEERGWRTIDTAPKDGEIILAGQWHLSGNWEVRPGQYLGTRWPFVGDGQPTLWMPLPRPPEPGD